MTATLLKELLKKKLWFITGKGGVGKTCVATALGLFAAKYGKKTLLIETHNSTRLSDIFAHQACGYHETNLQKNLSLIQINSQEAFKEYALRQIHFAILYRGLFENRFVKNFMEGTPGLTELLTIGKVWDLIIQDKYDLVIVDAPATGHALAMLDVPQTVATAIRVGPLKTKADAILALLQDPLATSVMLVTLCEEMPIRETLESIEKLQKNQIPLGPIFANQLWPQFFDAEALQKLNKAKDKPKLLKHYLHRLAMTEHYLAELTNQVETLPVLKITEVWQAQDDYQLCKDMMEQLCST